MQMTNDTAAKQPAIPRPSRIYRLAPWIAGILFFGIYAATAAPSIAALFDDSLEFQFVLPTFGIAHPTGYPLYTILGGLWSALLPVGNWAWRANLFSALAGGAAVALVYVTARRLVNRPSPLAPRSSPHLAPLVAVLAFGLGPVWWMQATVAEVYALHNLLVAAILAVVLGIEDKTGAAFDRRMALLFLLVGLGLAHHRTTVLLIPGLAVYLLWSVPGIWRLRRIWWLWAAALLAPLLLYLYLPLRAAAGVSDLHGSYTNTWSGFWQHVLATGYAGFFGTADLRPALSMVDWLQFALAQLGWPATLLALLGLTGLAAPGAARRGWVLIALVMVTNLLFALAYQVGDQEVFLLPALLCAALFAGGGASFVMGRTPVRYGWLAGALLLLLTMLGVGRGAPVNRSQDWTAHDYAVDMATVDFPPGSRVLGIEGEMTALRYMQLAEGLGLNATPVAADQAAVRRERLAETVAAGAPAYLTRELEGITDAYSFSGAGPLVRVWPRGAAAVGAPGRLLGLGLLDGAATITGYDLQRLDWAGGPVARLTLYWLPTAPMTQTLKVSLRLVQPDGAPLSWPDGAPAVEDRFPLRQVAPTTTWLPGETVRDVHEIALPPALPAGARLQVIVYDAETLAEVGRFEVDL